MEPIERKRTIVWDDPKVSARDADSTSGLDYLRSIKDGSISPPPDTLYAHGVSTFLLFKTEKEQKIEAAEPPGEKDGGPNLNRVLPKT